MTFILYETLNSIQKIYYKNCLNHQCRGNYDKIDAQKRHNYLVWSWKKLVM